MAEFAVGDYVRSRNNPAESGIVTLVAEHAPGKPLVSVRLSTGVRRYPASQLEFVPVVPETPAELVRGGHLPAPDDLRRQFSHVRLSGSLADVLYSMESSDTDFYAHQFKPVVKILDSPTGNLLIADEVGLGKTIEAGLVWGELAARYKYNRFVVVCPKVLCEKWREELKSKFGVEARICNAEGLLEVLSSTHSQRAGFAVICGMQSIRPRQKTSRNGRPVDVLAKLLEDSEGLERLIDLLVIDEAHHMRNPGTATNKLGQLLCGVSEHVAMLSATPINLHNRDLLSLLRLLDELTFRDEYALEQIIHANQPLVAAREAVLSGQPVEDVFQLVLAASRSPILRNAKALRLLVGDLKVRSVLDPTERAEIAKRLERVNLLSNVISRTRRRDVQELRVQRDVVAYKARMTPDERSAYDTITSAILRYALERGLPTGFLTVMPQRMLASSMPAALMHWHMRVLSDLDEDEDQEIDETGVSSAENEAKPLMAVLYEVLRKLPSSDEMARQDTKFAEFIRVVQDRRADEPLEKFVVFSTFRGTLSYLRQRLDALGIVSLTLRGETIDRSAVVNQFRDDPKISVLLTSEVGSEGIDLQFARTVVNYDLPWNPMRVEQRIGRIDRLGQEAPSISVLNLMHSDTVDERIYHRLHERLGLCKRALGGFEEILGQEISELTKELLSGKLSPEDEERRLAQTEQAIANRRSEEEALELEAAALFAHGDYIVRSINESRSEGNWVTEKDIVDYLEGALRFLFPSSDVHWQVADGLVSVRLSDDCRFEFENWCADNRLNSGPVGRRGGATTFKVGKAASRLKHPRLGPTHPLIRFLSRLLTERDALKPMATAIRIANAQARGLEPGMYVGAIEEWEFGKGATSTVIGCAVANLRSGELLPETLADQVVTACLAHAGHWPTALEEADLGLAADRIEMVLEPSLAQRFAGASERREVELGDRVAIQLASLEAHAERQRANLERVISSSVKQLEAANRARLSRFEEGVEMRRRKIEAQSVTHPSSRQMAAFLLKVEAE
ncbi:SNF2-related protein [Sinirhodobacter sp. WL0062]|uniref:SNF2-related protein n=1 Tax=Rhodobacter flavimaris TaxID=2907145 RepID=A0ABS8YSK8_9RHOB|nr:helicase-related protein [Sinirhodobacter sp. WL0062]MCE5972443.1 SNF2-related protein [Sinirhodobacter sp. WL0062]